MVSIKRIATIKSLSLYLTVELTETIHNGTIKVVKIINSIEIPSIPTL